MDRVFLTLAFVMMAAPAFAVAVAIPEPGSMTLFATAIAGAYVIRKLKIRK